MRESDTLESRLKVEVETGQMPDMFMQHPANCDVCRWPPDDEAGRRDRLLVLQLAHSPEASVRCPPQEQNMPLWVPRLVHIFRRLPLYVLELTGLC